MTASPLKTSIILRALELNVFLGWPEAERAQPQVILADIYIQYPITLKACSTDNLADTYCYDTLVQLLREKIAGREFRLLEYFGHEVYQIVKQAVTADIKISVRVQKHPPISGLTGGVIFHCGDENNSW